MELDMNVTDVKESVESENGKVTDVGYETIGSYTKAFVEAYFKQLDEVPELEDISNADNIVVTDDWDAENNGVMYEVTIAER